MLGKDLAAVVLVPVDSGPINVGRKGIDVTVPVDIDRKYARGVVVFWLEMRSDGSFGERPGTVVFLPGNGPVGGCSEQVQVAVLVDIGRPNITYVA